MCDYQYVTFTNIQPQIHTVLSVSTTVLLQTDTSTILSHHFEMGNKIWEQVETLLVSESPSKQRPLLKGRICT